MGTERPDAETAAAEISAQFVLVPASDRFIPIILDAVDSLPAVPGLDTATDGISSHITGTPAVVFGAMGNCFVQASRSGAHIVQTMLMRRGGPAGVVSALPVVDEAAIARLVERFGSPQPSGIFTVAEFTLFAPGAPDDGDLGSRYLPFLSAAGLRTRNKVLSTRLDGDAAHVMAALRLVLIEASLPLPHVLMTATLTSNLPEGEADR